MSVYEKTYTVVGGGPSAAMLLPSMPRSDRIITTNAGILLCRPDWYYLNDAVACSIYAQAGRDSGATCVTVRRSPAGIELRGIGDFAQIDAPEGGRFTLGSYSYHPLSGVMCVQMAVNFGASLVRLVGFDGYAAPERMLSKNASQEKKLQEIVDACPRVMFEWYGDTVLRVSGANVIRIGNKAAA